VPDPIPFWIPGLLGALSAAVLMLSSMAAGSKQADMAWDEGYVSEARQAAVVAFWVNMALYPLFGVLMAGGLASTGVSLAAISTLTAATYLILTAWFGLRGQA
jgi:hypothetical protein